MKSKWPKENNKENTGTKTLGSSLQVKARIKEENSTNPEAFYPDRQLSVSAWRLSYTFPYCHCITSFYGFFMI